MNRGPGSDNHIEVLFDSKLYETCRQQEGLLELPGTAELYEMLAYKEKFERFKHEASVLQGYSVDATFELMENDDCNILSGLSQKQLGKFKNLVNMLLIGTSTRNYLIHLNYLSVFSTLHYNKLAKSDITTAMCYLLKCADFSQASKGKD